MKHKIIPIMAAVVWGLCFSALPAQAKYGGGTGEPNDPYLIYTAEQMNEIGLNEDDWDKHFLLCADIDLSDYTGPRPLPPQPPPPPLYASNPTPADGAFSVRITADLSWTAGLGATSHDVYFGTSSIPPFVCNQISTTFGPGTMDFSTRYFWRIDEVSESVTTTGDIWSFTTMMSPPPPPPPPVMADIDLSDYSETAFNIIGYFVDWYDYKAFTGVFDGNGHTISNFSYTTIDKSYIGLFGYIDDTNAEVKNLGLVNPNIDAGSYVGSLVGYLSDGTITDCYAEGGSVSVEFNVTVGGLVGTNEGTITNCYSTVSVSKQGISPAPPLMTGVGGLVGRNTYGGNIINCYSIGSVEGSSVAGGLVGCNFDGIVTDCYSEAEVSGTNKVGGLVGYNYSGTITNCDSTGSVSGEDCVGGLVGYNYYYATITHCYSAGSIEGANDVGGLVGDNRGTINNCYSTGSVAGDTVVGGLVGWNGVDSTISNCYSSGCVTGITIVGGLVGSCGYWNPAFASFWDIETSGQTTSAGGAGKTTAEMQMVNTFIGWAGCGNEGIWTLDEDNDYPHLWWEEKSGDPLPAYKLSDFIAGIGTESDPYLIYTPDELNKIGLFACDWDKHFLLCADIDLNSFTGSEFNIIGANWDNSFRGFFDGSGHTISNFSYTFTGTDDVGLFRYVVGGQIKNLGLIDPDVDAVTRGSVGSLVGNLQGGTITNCYVKGGNVFGSNRVGGLVGNIGNYGFVMDCYTETNVTATGTSAGSIVGSVYHGKVTGSFANGSVSGNNSVGGLIGTSQWCDIKDSYSSGDTYGIENVGGLLGYAEWENTIFENCYAAGIVSGGNNSGGLIGKSISSTVLDCYWDIEKTGQLTSEGGGAGKTTAQMKDVETYLGWSCETKWTIDEGKDYPRLLWENMPGQIISRPLEVYGGGTGTANDPYLLYTPKQFNSIGLFECDWDKQFKLMADIDIGCYTGAEFNVTGHLRNRFRGVFDGNGKRVLNFTVDIVGRAYNGIFGFVGSDAEIKNLTIINPNINTYGDYTGALIGRVPGTNVTVYNCHIVNGTISGRSDTGGLVGSSIYSDSIKITKCSTSCNVNGKSYVGGLVGFFSDGNIFGCSAKGNVTGTGDCIGGLVGRASNPATIENSFSRGNVSGGHGIGGLIGHNWNPFSGRVIKCYSVGKVHGDGYVGGLIGDIYYPVGVENSFWDVQTSGVLYSAGGIGLTTFQMQTQNMYINAGWDFTTPVWIIDEGVDYPRLWWELVPVLHAEPEVTLGTSNTISWEPVVGDVEYYAECAEDANFTSIIYNSGWITETSCEFTGLQLGKRYWYSVKARNAADVETGWSNVESSLQGTLADAVEIGLEPESLKNKNMKNALLNKIDAALKMIEEANYTGALSKLRNDILAKMNGCGEKGEPDKNDWIITCEEQSEMYPLVIETIEYVRSLME